MTFNAEELRSSPYYVLDLFSCPSVAGLHVGHPEGYTATDVVARYKSMKSFNLLHPLGCLRIAYRTVRRQVGIHLHSFCRRILHRS